ncbi:hypothetical protein Trydic_g16622 [Trypoxylus dichotomus]
MKDTEFGLQLDEATDSNKAGHLICYLLFLDDNSIETFCSATALLEAQKLNAYYVLDKFIIENDLNWDKCIGICIDRARSMSRGLHGMWSHWIIQKKILVSKSIGCQVNLVIRTCRRRSKLHKN